MPEETPAELGAALDDLVLALDAAVTSNPRNSERSTAVTSAVQACSAIARARGLRPEQLIIAIKPRIARIAARVPSDKREGYLRAVVSLAIESYFNT
jgi:hypothetical protein